MEIPKPNPNTDNQIIDHVPSDAELKAAKMIADLPTRSEMEASRNITPEQALGIGNSVLKATETTLETKGFDVKRETERQMGIAAADRKNRASAGLPPRTFDLR